MAILVWWIDDHLLNSPNFPLPKIPAMQYTRWKHGIVGQACIATVYSDS